MKILLVLFLLFGTNITAEAKQFYVVRNGVFSGLIKTVDKATFNYSATNNTIDIYNMRLSGYLESPYGAPNDYRFTYLINYHKFVLENGSTTLDCSTRTAVGDIETEYKYLTSYFPTMKATNLSPNTVYYIQISTDTLTYNGEHYIYNTRYGGGSADHIWGNQYGETWPSLSEGCWVITAPNHPILSASKIKDKSLVININANGNPQGLNYRIERSADGVAWTTITTTTSLDYTDSQGLVPETKYFYRAIAQGSGSGEDYHESLCSQIIEITTTADPAVAAAQEAALKASAAEQAAKETLQYSTDAKNAAERAESKASEAVDLIKGLKTEFNATVAPFIKSVKSINNATATKNANFTVLVSALNATQYRAGVNGIFTEWQLSPQVDVPLPMVGVNTIEVQARRSSVEGATVANDYITVFRLK